MILAIQQPEHIPWIGFFNKMAQCDLFIYLDNVQFKKRYFENRNKISHKTETLWLTVPVSSKNLYTQNICNVKIDYDQAWINKYKGRLEHTYGKHPFWNELREIVYPSLDQSFKKLADLNLVLINKICHYLGINTLTALASEMTCKNLKGTDLILEICAQSNARVYISGPDGANYLNLEQFLKNGIEVVYHTFEHPEYPQVGENFVSHLSILDLIANCGDKSLSYINTYHK